MKHSVKYLSLILLAALFLLPSCAKAEAGVGDASLSEWTDLESWPDNRFTQQVPAPEAGTPLSCTQGSSAGYEFFAIRLEDMDQDELAAYRQAAEDAGFLPLSQKEEAPGGLVTVGEVWQKGDVGLSLAWSGDGLVIWISLLADSQS